MILLERAGKILEPMMLVTGLISPLATVPQLYKLYLSHGHHAAGLSIITWVMYLLVAAL